jgi:hypothetical protein
MAKLKRRVIDTNVLVVANGKAAQVGPQTKLKTIQALQKFMVDGIAIVDDGGDIRSEYLKHCNAEGQPPLGNIFFREIMINQFASRVISIKAPKNNSGEYINFPNVPELNGFDRDDRKFAVVAKLSNSPVLNAVDTDWIHFLNPLKSNGIKVMFTAGEDPSKWVI